MPRGRVNGLLPELLGHRSPEADPDIIAPRRAVPTHPRHRPDARTPSRPISGDLIVTRLIAVPWRVAAAPAMAGELARLCRWSDAPWIA